MEFRDVVEKRVRVRQFRKDPVSPADVREMVRLASLAPSPNNQQPWRFIAVTRSSLLRDMAEAVHARVRAMLPEPGSDDARRAATSLALEAGLVAVIGPSCPADLETIAPLLTEAGLPLLTPASPGPRPYLLARQLFEAIRHVAYQAGDGTLVLPRQALAQALQNTP